MDSKNSPWFAIAMGLGCLLAIASLLWLVGGNQSAPNTPEQPSFSGASDSGWNATGDGCIAVDGTCVIDASGNLDGVITSTTGSFSGLLTLNAGTLNSYPNSTSTTATTQTLVAADIANYDTVLITPNTGDLTLTFPASSTLSAFVPTAGDRATQCWHNATTTAGIDITFSAGTGIDLEFASSSQAVQVKTLLADGFVCFEYVRKAATASAFDIGVLMTRYSN